MWINLIITQVLLYQTCQGISQSEDIGIQTISTQKAGCQPLDENLNKYVCSGLNGEVDLSNSIWELPKKIEHLTIDDSANLTMDLATLMSFTKLTQLIFQDSQVSELKLSGSMSPNQIKVLKFIRSWSSCPEVVSLASVGCETKLLDLNATVIYSLRGLEEMHVFNCTISRLTQPELPIILNITGGSINCLVPEHRKLPLEDRLVDFLWMSDWIKNKNATLSDDVNCFLNVMHFIPLYSLNNLSIKKFIDVDQEIMEYCPSKCKCNVVAMTMDPALYTYKPKVEVACNNISLAKLPSIFPKHTTSFVASHNNLTEINEIFENDVYLKIHKFTLDHNQIRNIDGEKFYNYLVKRSLNAGGLDFAIDFSHNEISEFPALKVKEAFRNKLVFPYIRLTNNPLNCQKCDFLVEFQYVLAHYAKTFDEEERLEVRCSKSSGYERPVLSLDVSTVCPSDEPYMDQIDFINIALAAVLLVVLANFAYNLYQYKTYSKLPWLVTKGPLGISQAQ